MKHNPLRNSDNTLLRLVKRRKLCQHGVVGIRHVAVKAKIWSSLAETKASFKSREDSMLVLVRAI